VPRSLRLRGFHKAGGITPDVTVTVIRALEVGGQEDLKIRKILFSGHGDFDIETPGIDPAIDRPQDVGILLIGRPEVFGTAIRKAPALTLPFPGIAIAGRLIKDSVNRKKPQTRCPIGSGAGIDYLGQTRRFAPTFQNTLQSAGVEGEGPLTFFEIESCNSQSPVQRK
jgi:hypothetical protein